MKERKLQMIGYQKRLDERKKYKCNTICEGIKDEQDGQKYYLKLNSMFPNKGILNMQYSDEIEHEKLLRKLKNETNCGCL